MLKTAAYRPRPKAALGIPAGACCIRRNNRSPSTVSNFLTIANKLSGNSSATWWRSLRLCPICSLVGHQANGSYCARFFDIVRAPKPWHPHALRQIRELKACSQIHRHKLSFNGTLTGHSSPRNPDLRQRKAAYSVESSRPINVRSSA